MAWQFNNCVVLFIVIYCQMLFVNSAWNISKSAEISLSRNRRDIPGPIKLSGIVEVRKYALWEREKKCDLYATPSPLIITGDDVIVNTNISKLNCHDGEWILKWDVADLGKQFPSTNCSSRTYSPRCNYEWTPCICVSPHSYQPKLDKNAVKSFSLHPAETRDNRVVTGFRFTIGNNNNVIQLEIQVAELLKNGTVEKEKIWEVADFKKFISNPTAHDDAIKLEYNRDYISFSYDTRTMFLDEIFVPDDYVVTGVRFAGIGFVEGHKGIKLQVKGTKYDSKFHLTEGSERWFDYTDRINENPSYNYTRREIRLDNCTDPTQTQNHIEISDTNRFVSFRATDMLKDSERHVIPYLSGEGAEIIGNSPLRGVGLSYKGKEGFGGYVITKVFRHESLIYTPDGKLKPKPGSATKNYCQFVVFSILPLLLIFL